MAFKLSKADKSRIEQFASQLAASRESVRTEAQRYNDLLEEARGFITGIAGDLQEEFADKTERWQEGDRGTATQGWIEQLEGIELIEIEVEEDDENVSVLEELPSEPDY